MCKVQNLKLKNPSNILISYLNINSIRNKFSDLNLLINKVFDVITIAETKLDESFPSAQFMCEEYQFPPFRLDCTSNSGGLLTYVKNDIPARRLVDFDFDSSLQILPIELRFRKEKLLLFNIYRPDRTNIDLFLNSLSDAIHFYEMYYDNIIIVGNFNLEYTDPKISSFLDLNDFKNIMKSKTCFKSTRGTCIDLILSNSSKYIKTYGTVETGLSDFHLLIYFMLKKKYDKLAPKIIKYRDYKHFDKIKFLYELNYCVYQNHLEKYSDFENIFTNILEKHAPLKTKFLRRANNKPHVTKELRKAIMKRTHLKSLANKSNKPEDWAHYRTQRN